MLTARDLRTYGNAPAVTNRFTHGPQQRPCLTCDEPMQTIQKDQRICRRCQILQDDMEKRNKLREAGELVTEPDDDFDGK